MTGHKGRNSHRSHRRKGGDGVGNVIPFPARAERNPTAEPEFMEAIDSILSIIVDPSSYPDAPDARSAIDVIHALSLHGGPLATTGVHG